MVHSSRLLCCWRPQDTFRSFQGADGYAQFRWVADNVSEPRAVRVSPLCRSTARRAFLPYPCRPQCKADPAIHVFLPLPTVLHIVSRPVTLAPGQRTWRHVANAKAGVGQVVTRMRLLDRGSGVLAWRLRGALGPLPIDVDFESVYKLNLLTGRVEEHRYSTRNRTSDGE